MGRDLVCIFPQAMAVLENAERRCDPAAAERPALSAAGVDARDPEAACGQPTWRKPAVAAISLAMLGCYRFSDSHGCGCRTQFR